MTAERDALAAALRRLGPYLYVNRKESDDWIIGAVQVVLRPTGWRLVNDAERDAWEEVFVRRTLEALSADPTTYPPPGYHFAESSDKVLHKDEPADDLCGAFLTCAKPIMHDGPHERADGVDWRWPDDEPADEATALLRADQKRQEEAVDLFRRYGFVFDNTGKGGGKRWEKLAFTLYGYIVESSEAARAYLARVDGGGDE